jgi:preprotein translocase subunit YajC
MASKLDAGEAATPVNSALAAGTNLAAANTSSSSGGSSPVFLILIVVLAIVWIFMLRSNKRRKQTEMAKRDAIQTGSKVLLSGGLIGTLIARVGDRATVELGPGVVVEVMAGGILRTVEDPAADPAADPTEPAGTAATTGAFGQADVDEDEDSTEPVRRDEPVDLTGNTDSAQTDVSSSAVTENGRPPHHG